MPRRNANTEPRRFYGQAKPATPTTRATNLDAIARDLVRRRLASPAILMDTEIRRRNAREDAP